MKIDVRVLIIERDYFSRRGLKFLIAIDPRVRLTGEIESFDQLDTTTEDFVSADILLINASQFDSYDGLRELVSAIHRDFPQKKFVLFDVPNPERLDADLFALGVAGLLCKNEIRDGIASALTRAFQGQIVISDSVAKFTTTLPARIRDQIHVIPPGLRFGKLSKRLYQVADLYAGGLTPVQIADELKLEPQTVRTYIKRIYAIVNASDKWQVFQRLTARQDEDED
jgi:DNA-binding NarL/FixJ family response regulator